MWLGLGNDMWYEQKQSSQDFKLNEGMNAGLIDESSVCVSLHSPSPHLCYGQAAKSI